jgi:hypothetical protein
MRGFMNFYTAGRFRVQGSGLRVQGSANAKSPIAAPSYLNPEP